MIEPTTPGMDSTSRSAAIDQTGVVQGDRLCAACGFNLHGQTIVREPHYGMLAVRCPECATIAALQEYPLLGRWAERFAVLLAVGWLGAVVTLAIMTGSAVFGTGQQVAYYATLPGARQIGLAFAEYARANADPNAPEGSMYDPQQLRWCIENEEPAQNFADVAWLQDQDLRAVATGKLQGRKAISGGRGVRTTWRALVLHIPLAIHGIFWGALWSVLLLHRALRGQIVFITIIVTLVIGATLMRHLSPYTAYIGFWPWRYGYYNNQVVPVSEIAVQRFGLPMALGAVGSTFIAMLLGLLIGRKIARLIVRVLLPPHLRGPLAVLWHVDGLPSPPTRKAFWVRG